MINLLRSCILICMIFAVVFMIGCSNDATDFKKEDSGSMTDEQQVKQDGNTDSLASDSSLRRTISEPSETNENVSDEPALETFEQNESISEKTGDTEVSTEAETDIESEPSLGYSQSESISEKTGETETRTDAKANIEKDQPPELSNQSESISEKTGEAEAQTDADEDIGNKPPSETSDQSKSVSPRTNETESNTEESKKSKSPYQDGSYNASAEGYNGPITVAVTISEGEISKIVVTDSTDDEPYLTDSKTILKNVIDSQTANVDVVTGATVTCDGIIKAVKKALAKAAL